MGTEEPENQGSEQRPTGIGSLKPLVWFGAHLPGGQDQARGRT